MTKWTENLTTKLRDMAGDDTVEVTRDSVSAIAEALEISNRSVSSKLRKEGYTVETAGSAPRSFSDEETEELRSILEENSGVYTYAEIAEQLGTDHQPRAVQGKILSMELTKHVRPTPPKEVERTYTDEETAKVICLIQSGKCLEEIAEATGKALNSVRGKALSLLKANAIDALPVQRDKKAAPTDIFEQLGSAIADMTVDELVEKTGKTQRGVKTILTRRKLTAKDYDGAKKAEKANA